MTIRCVVIEDERLSREDLTYFLDNFEDIEIVGVADDGEAGLRLVKECKPDVVFLDINMPGMDGMEVARKLRYLLTRPKVVFTTAHKEYAADAFELGVLDYLLKPYDERRVHQVVERLRTSMVNTVDGGMGNTAHGTVVTGNVTLDGGRCDRIAVCLQERTLIINVDKITYCEAENEKVIVHTYEGQFQSSCTLKEMQDKTDLFRIHRSCIVNLRSISELYPWFNGSYQLILDDATRTTLTVSRSHVKELKLALGM